MKGYNFGDPRAPDVMLHGTVETSDTPWKVVLKSDCENQAFVLFINDTAFTDLPIQVDLIHEGPQNIDNDNFEVKLNGFLWHKGFK